MTVNSKFYVDVESFHQFGNQDFGPNRYLNLDVLDDGSHFLSITPEKQNLIEVMHKLKWLLNGRSSPLTVAEGNETRGWKKKYTDFVKDGTNPNKDHSEVLNKDIGAIKHVLEKINLKVETMCKKHSFQLIKQIFQQLPYTLMVQSTFKVEISKACPSNDQRAKNDEAANVEATEYKDVIADEQVKFLHECPAPAFSHLSSYAFLLTSQAYIPMEGNPEFFSCGYRIMSLTMVITRLAVGIFITLGSLFITLTCQESLKYASTCGKILDLAAVILLAPVLAAIGSLRAALGTVIHPRIAICN